MYSVSETFIVTASLINETWDEYTITWMNKPEHREIITTFAVAEGKIYKIDITNYIEGRDNISICLNASDYYQNGYVQGHSCEGAYSSEDYPQLIWTYPETVEITVTSPVSSDYWEELNTYTIKWSSVGSISRVIIQLYKGMTFIEDITYSYTDNDGEYDFYVSILEDYFGTNYRIKITDYDDSRVYAYSDYFSINYAIITLTSPSSSDVLRVGEQHTITWTSKGSIDIVRIGLYKGTEFIEYIATSTNNDGIYKWTVGTYETGSDYSIGIWDYYDTDVYDFSARFTIENPIIPIIIIATIITVAIIGIGITIIILRKKKIKRDISPKPAPPIPVKPESSQKIEITPTFCSNCGREVKKGERFCMNCGNEL